MKGRPYVVVVDDDQEMLRMLKCTLKREGYGVATATDSSSALALLEERRLDLVILDILMPELDGFQVVELMRQRSSVPIIMLTARSEVDSLQKALAVGANDYVRMPFQARKLVTCIKAKFWCPVPRNLRQSLAG